MDNYNDLCYMQNVGVIKPFFKKLQEHLPKQFAGKSALKKLAKFTGKDLFWSLFFQCNTTG